MMRTDQNPASDTETVTLELTSRSFRSPETSRGRIRISKMYPPAADLRIAVISLGLLIWTIR